MPRKCPLCSSKNWAGERKIDLKRTNIQVHEVDAGIEEMIIGEYRKGRSCVDISIAKGIPYSLVFDIVRRNTTNINIKV